MDGLVAEGFILLGGPLADEHRVVHVVEAESDDEVVHARARSVEREPPAIESVTPGRSGWTAAAINQSPAVASRDTRQPPRSLPVVVRSGSELAEEIKRFGRERLPAYAYPLLVGSPASCRRP